MLKYTTTGCLLQQIQLKILSDWDISDGLKLTPWFEIVL